MSDKIHASRLEEFKANVKGAVKGAQDLRRKRAEVSVALRKQARDEQLLKRRALSPEPDDDEQKLEKLPSPKEIVAGLNSGDLLVMTKSARAARRTLSREQNPPISAMVAAGCIKPLLNALDKFECSDLQFEAAWALTNIASGTSAHTHAVMDSGALPKLIYLLGRGGQVGEQCAWAVGNIAGDGAQARDLVLSHGVLPALLPMLEKTAPATQLKTAVWTFSNLCRNKDPLVKFELVAPALPYLAELLTISDKDVLADACWAISYLTDGPNERIEGVQIVPGLMSRLVKLLAHSSPAVQTPALRAIGNCVTGSDHQTDHCIEAGCLSYLYELLGSSKSSLVKEASWACSNILAGSSEQIQKAIDSGMLDRLVLVLQHHEAKCQKESAWAITNLCQGGNGQQLSALISSGFLPPYCALLGSPDPRTVTVVLEGLTNFLQAAERFGEVDQLCLKLEEDGVVDRLESLQTHENEEIYKKTLHIIDTYFADNDDGENQEPNATAEEFQFGPTDQKIGNF